MFGSWEDKGSGPVYVVSAICATGCHDMTLMIDPLELDHVASVDAVWAHVERYIRDAFQGVHG